MKPLEEAFADGRVAEGDHVAMALDHPLDKVPIHYLDLAGELAVRRLTFSRVASLADLRRIAVHGPRRPAGAGAVYAPTSDALNPTLHATCFAASVAPLTRCFGDLTVVACEEAEPARILGLLATRDLVHLHAHGRFPPASPTETIDPMRKAGLLVATSEGLPSRSDPERFLLRGVDVLR